MEHDASKRPSAGALVSSLQSERPLDFGVSESDTGVKNFGFLDEDYYDLDVDDSVSADKVEAFGAAGLAPRCTNLFSFTDALHLFHASIFTLFRFLFCFVRSSWYHGDVARGDAEAKLKVRIHKIYFY